MLIFAPWKNAKINSAIFLKAIILLTRGILMINDLKTMNLCRSCTGHIVKKYLQDIRRIKIPDNDDNNLSLNIKLVICMYDYIYS